MKSIGLLFSLLILNGLCLSASDLSLSDPILFVDQGQPYAIVNVQWQHAWNHERNHDAVWVFFKFLRGPQNGYIHSQLAKKGHQIIDIEGAVKQKMALQVSEDQVGLMLFPTEPMRGTVHVRLKVCLDTAQFNHINRRNSRFTAYGIEMVYIPEGSFYVGDIDSAALKFGAFYAADGKGQYKDVFHVQSEQEPIQVGPDKGNLYYRSPDDYKGDQKGPIPATFPKGVQAFYIMKYEPTQGQYCDFLNSLSDHQSQLRANFGGRAYYAHRGSIRIEHGNYQATYPQTPCNFMSWDDAMAYADWAGLRPMTELEFTKAARGPSKPTARDFPWGNADKTAIQRMVSPEGPLIMENSWTEIHMKDANKAVFGASYYWVMDLAGSMWERVITVGDSIGRSFEGGHGDGRISWYGYANTADWPAGNLETGGFGFRGGGFYAHGREYHDFNPYSPVAYRPYGAWPGGNRTEAYGTRFVRTAKK